MSSKTKTRHGLNSVTLLLKKKMSAKGLHDRPMKRNNTSIRENRAIKKRQLSETSDYCYLLMKYRSAPYYDMLCIRR